MNTMGDSSILLIVGAAGVLFLMLVLWLVAQSQEKVRVHCPDNRITSIHGRVLCVDADGTLKVPME